MHSGRECLHEQEAGGMAYGCDECAPQICLSGRTAYSGKTDSRYRRKQCILKKMYEEMES